MTKKISTTNPNTVDKCDPMSSMRMKLKLADPEVQNYVAALESENLKLHRQIAKLQADNVSLKNGITASNELRTEKLHAELKKRFDSACKSSST